MGIECQRAILKRITSSLGGDIGGRCGAGCLSLIHKSEGASRSIVTYPRYAVSGLVSSITVIIKTKVRNAPKFAIPLEFLKFMLREMKSIMSSERF